jgi:type I restriction enzyme S subunit
MKSWPTKPLTEVAAVIRGVSFDKSQVSSEPRKNSVPVLRAGNIQESLLTDSDLVYVSDEQVNEEQRMRRGDLAICMSSGSPAIVGKTAYLATDWNGSVGAFCAIIRFNDKLHHRFASYWFRSPAFTQWRDNNAKGANIQNLRRTELETLSIPVPPMAEQEQIVKLLDEADDLRNLRGQADQRTSALIPALFHQMFGDMGDAECRWPKERLGQLATIEATLVDPRLEVYQDLPHIGPDRIERDTGKLFPTKTAREDALISAKFLFDESEVLYSKIRPNLRKAALPTCRGLCSADMYPIRPGPQLLREFLWAYLLTDHFTDRAVDLSARVNMPKLNRVQLDSIDAPVPPLPLQKEFAQRVTEIRELEAGQATSRIRLHALFQSMLHRAFNGEL